MSRRTRTDWAHNDLSAGSLKVTFFFPWTGKEKGAVAKFHAAQHSQLVRDSITTPDDREGDDVRVLIPDFGDLSINKEKDKDKDIGAELVRQWSGAVTGECAAGRLPPSCVLSFMRTLRTDVSQVQAFAKQVIQQHFGLGLVVFHTRRFEGSSGAEAGAAVCVRTAEPHLLHDLGAAARRAQGWVRVQQQGGGAWVLQGAATRLAELLGHDALKLARLCAHAPEAKLLLNAWAEAADSLSRADLEEGPPLPALPPGGEWQLQGGAQLELHELLSRLRQGPMRSGASHRASRLADEETCSAVYGMCDAMMRQQGPTCSALGDMAVYYVLCEYWGD